MRAFNAHDFDKQYSFNANDVSLHIPDPKTGMLHGKEGIRRLYLALFETCDEYVVPMVLMNDAHKVFLVMESYFVYKEKLEGVFEYQLEKGDISRFAFGPTTRIENGKMQSIVCNLFQSWFLGKDDIRALARESGSRAERDLKVFNY